MQLKYDAETKESSRVDWIDRLMWNDLFRLLGIDSHSQKNSSPKPPASHQPSKIVVELPNGEVGLADPDPVWLAWTSFDLDTMMAAVNLKTDLVNRHFLLMGIVNLTYKRRTERQVRSTLYEIAELHITEFPSIAPALKADMDGELPRVTTFQHFATVLTEDGKFEDAIRVCRMAIDFGLDDGTKGGFEGRIERIQKKQAKHQGKKTTRN